MYLAAFIQLQQLYLANKIYYYHVLLNTHEVIKYYPFYRQ